MAYAPNFLQRYGVTDEQWAAFGEALDDIEDGLYLSDDWICRHLGITHETLHQMIEAGDFLPPVPDA